MADDPRDEARSIWRCTECGRWSHAARKPAWHKRTVVDEPHEGMVVVEYMQPSADPYDESEAWIVRCGPFVEYQVLPAIDAADPLRALLADEDQAVELVAGVIGRNMVIRKGPPEIASAVLAALREVANSG